tara:strand:+ start:1706 stop:2422 length:717 start_codon:yes stop_codon:yes gene_type:complete
MDKINNKNAREKALLEEAYGNVYKEEFNPRRDAPSHKRGDPHPATRAAEDIVDREVMWGRYSGVVDEVDVERGVAWVITDDDGGLHEVELGNFDHIGDKREREREDEENPNADTYDKQGRKLGIVAALEGEDAESREERADVDKYEYEQGKEAGERDVTTKFQPGQFVDVLGDDGEFSHQEVVLKVTGDVVNTIRVVGDGKPYGDTAKGYYDINLISPQDLESGKYSADFKPADGREY